MTPFERLYEVFNRGLDSGVEALSPSERELFRIEDFLVEYEMNGLSGYFYNRLPDLDGIVATVAAMRRYGLTALGDLLGEAVDLFKGYVDPDPPSTWGKVLRRYDPRERLDRIAKRINALNNYGLDASSIR